VAAFVTAGVGALAHLGPETPPIVWHHRLIQVLASGGVAWLGVALAVREVLRHTASDRSARRQTLPFTIVGLATTLALAGYLTVQQTRTYMQFFDQGTSETLALLGPSWGLVGWLAVVLAWLLSMWLVRHTARTILDYFFGIAATIYLGLFGHTKDLYAYLIYAVAGYGAAHLAVYLWEARFMALLSRTCALYREERRASTTIFTLAAASCLAGAGLAVFRLHTMAALLMLAIMAGVFLAWAFIWLRGEMLYPAVLMVTLVVLAIWHHLLHPKTWDAGRLAVNAMVLGGSAFVWLGIAKTLDPIRGEVYQLAAPARASSVILGLVGVGFAAAMAVSPTFGGDVWRQPRTAWDWTLGLSALALLMGYFAWARFALDRRFFGLVSGAVALLLGLYVGIYIGVRL
jgi:hypothetical protein